MYAQPEQLLSIMSLASIVSAVIIVAVHHIPALRGRFLGRRR